MVSVPKIHKPEIPLRPIVSCISTFAYDLSAHLADILFPLTGKSDYTVTSSTYFVSTISHERMQENEVMVPFDVESLFTNVPIKGAAKAALCKLENDPGLADRTNLTPLTMILSAEITSATDKDPLETLSGIFACRLLINSLKRTSQATAYRRLFHEVLEGVH